MGERDGRRGGGIEGDEKRGTEIKKARESERKMERMVSK